MAMEFPVGMFRKAMVEPKFPPFAAEIFGLVSGVFLACVVAYWFLHKGWFPSTRGGLYGIGFLWSIMTIMFEFLFFHYVMGHDWSSLTAAYRIDQGRLYLLGLVALLFVPMAVAQRNEVID